MNSVFHTKRIPIVADNGQLKLDQMKTFVIKHYDYQNVVNVSNCNIFHHKYHASYQNMQKRFRTYHADAAIHFS